MPGVSIRDLTRQNVKIWAGVPFDAVAEKVVPGWEISLVFVGEKRAQDLNKKLRGKTYVPNVLSYVVGEKHGEIIICPSAASRQASNFQLPASSFQLLLFIHALLHLKGARHGATMERSERTLVARFAPSASNAHPHVPSHRHRNRHRHLPGQAGGGRRAAR